MMEIPRLCRDLANSTIPDLSDTEISAIMDAKIEHRHTDQWVSVATFVLSTFNQGTVMATTLEKSVITCDMEGIIETYSSGAEVMFGYTSNETVGRLRVSFFSPGEIVLQNLSSWLGTAVKEGEYITDTNFIRKNGELFGARIRITPTFKAGKQVGFCGVTEELPSPVNVSIKGSTKMLRWLVITRAPFLTAAITPVVVGIAYSAGIAHAAINWVNALLAMCGVMMLHLASNVFNDYFDMMSGTDQANTKYFTQYSGGSRAIEMRLIDMKGTRSLALMLMLLAFAIGVYLSVVVGQGVLIIGIIGLICGYFYTAPPVRLVARRGLGELAISVAFGPLITYGMYYVITGQYSWEAFLFGIPAGLLTTNILVINQVPDVEGDAATGKNHLIVTFGKKSAVWIWGIAWLAATALTAWLAFSYSKPLLWVPVTVSVLYGMRVWLYMRKHILERTLVKANVNTIYLQIVVTVLMAIALAL